jgi:hypothetical protein
MTAKAIQMEIHSVVALIAEPLSARMTFPAIIESYSESYFPSFSFTDNFLSDLF